VYYVTNTSSLSKRCPETFPASVFHTCHLRLSCMVRLVCCHQGLLRSEHDTWLLRRSTAQCSRHLGVSRGAVVFMFCVVPSLDVSSAQFLLQHVKWRFHLPPCCFREQPSILVQGEVTAWVIFIRTHFPVSHVPNERS
jgi:hypothetical protein